MSFQATVRDEPKNLELGAGGGGRCPTLLKLECNTELKSVEMRGGTQCQSCWLQIPYVEPAARVAAPWGRLAAPAFSALVFGMIATTHQIPGFGTMSSSLTKLLQVHNWESK